jgi:hypothetical protein
MQNMNFIKNVNAAADTHLAKGLTLKSRCTVTREHNNNLNTVLSYKIFPSQFSDILSENILKIVYIQCVIFLSTLFYKLYT